MRVQKFLKKHGRLSTRLLHKSNFSKKESWHLAQHDCLRSPERCPFKSRRPMRTRRRHSTLRRHGHHFHMCLFQLMLLLFLLLVLVSGSLPLHFTSPGRYVQLVVASFKCSCGWLLRVCLVSSVLSVASANVQSVSVPHICKCPWPPRPGRRVGHHWRTDNKSSASPCCLSTQSCCPDACKCAAIAGRTSALRVLSQSVT